MPAKARASDRRLFVGVDPGLTGAVAFLDPKDMSLEIHDTPVHSLKRNGKSKNELNEHGFALLFDRDDIEHAFVEKVSALPKQGVSSVFSFGQSFMAAKMALACHYVPFTLVPPAVWKKRLGVPAAKEGAARRANELFPKFAHLFVGPRGGVLDGRAEAALIAYYGYQELNKGAG